MTRKLRSLTFAALLPAALASGCAADAAEDGPSSELEAAATSAPRRVALRYALGSVVVVDVDALPGKKDVAIAYKTRAGSWATKTAKLLRTVNGHQLYYVDDLPTSTEALGNFTLRFAVRYRVDGRELWDNNGGRDYSAQTTDNWDGRCQLLACNYNRDGTRTCVDNYCKGAPDGRCTPRPAHCLGRSRPLLAPLGPGVEVALTDLTVQPHMGEIAFGLLVRDDAPQKKVSVIFRSDRSTETQTMNAKWISGKDGSESWWIPNGHLGLDYDEKVFFHVVVQQAGHTTRYDDFGKDFECRRVGSELSCAAGDVVDVPSWAK